MSKLRVVWGSDLECVYNIYIYICRALKDFSF